MRIVDTLHNEIGLGSDKYKDTVGIVIKPSSQLDNRPLLGVIIPKFQIGMTYNDGDVAEETEIEVSGSKCINDSSSTDFWDKKVIYKNYILVRPFLNQNQSMPEYSIGDKVIITTIDNDIKTLAFLPYSINRMGQRSTDILKLAIPATPEENTTLDEDNTYFVKLDSQSKVIILSTSNKNGEVAHQTIGMDAENGQIAITDNSDRTWLLDTQNDSITTITSGSKIEQIGDVINMESDTVNITTDSLVKIKTDRMEIEANTIKETATDVEYEFDNFTQTSDVGEWDVDDEKHSGSSFSIEYDTVFIDSPTIGCSGNLIFPSFTIGSISNINILPQPTNGDSSIPGAMMLKTDPAGVPLVKFPQLLPILTAIATDAATVPSSGSGLAMISSMAAQLGTQKIMAS